MEHIHHHRNQSPRRRRRAAAAAAAAAVLPLVPPMVSSRAALCGRNSVPCGTANQFACSAHSARGARVSELASTKSACRLRHPFSHVPHTHPAPHLLPRLSQSLSASVPRVDLSVCPCLSLVGLPVSLSLGPAVSRASE